MLFEGVWTDPKYARSSILSLSNTYTLGTDAKPFGGIRLGGASTIESIASVSFLKYNTANASGYHSFLIAGTEQWRISGSTLIGYNSTASQIQRTNDSGYLSIGGGSGAGAPATGAYITLRGGTASSPGIAIFSSGSNVGAYCSYAAEASAGYHSFTIASVEQWRITNTGIVGYDANNVIKTGASTSFLILQAGTSTGPSYGAYIQLGANSAASYTGQAYIQAGNISTGKIYLDAPHASGEIRIYRGGSEHIRFQSGVLYYIANSSFQSTGAGSAALGSNCPATTLSAPTTWVKVKLYSGVDGYQPVWV